MKKLSIAVAVLTAALVSAGAMAHHKSPIDTGKRTAPSTIQADFPAPVCPPYCALPTPTQVPN